MTDTTINKTPNSLTSGDFTAAEEPFALFSEWLNEAFKSEPADGNAMTLATVDKDGMPDVWEHSHGLNPADRADGARVSKDGYTNLEDYLNSLI